MKVWELEPRVSYLHGTPSTTGPTSPEHNHKADRYLYKSSKKNRNSYLKTKFKKVDKIVSMEVDNS